MGTGSEVLESMRRKALTVNEFAKSIHAEWFTSPSTFALLAIATPIIASTTMPDTMILRGILVMMHLGLVNSISKCPKCKGKVCLAQNDNRWVWRCSAKGHKCFRKGVNNHGFLKHIHVRHWLAFAHFLVMFTGGYRWSKIVIEMASTYGIMWDGTLISWRRRYQAALAQYLLNVDGIMIGGKNDVVVFDETNLGAQKGVRKAKPQLRSSTRSKPVVRKRIAKRLPARTIWKKPATSTRRRNVSDRSKRGTPKDLRSGGRWLWAAVLVGNGKKTYTHENGLKKFTFKVLPSPGMAPDGKPRGLQSMKKAIGDRIHQHSFVVFDKWKSSVTAIQQLKYKHAPPVNHSITWRDTASGFHSNDVESEFARLKKWIRERYGQLHFEKANDNEDDIDEGDLYEYTFYTNVGKGIYDVVKALHYVNGGSFKTPVL